MFGSCFWLLNLVAFQLNNTFFFYDPKSFAPENICHHLEQIFLNDVFFGCEIWNEPSSFAKWTTEKLPTLVAKS